MHVHTILSLELLLQLERSSIIRRSTQAYDSQRTIGSVWPQNGGISSSFPLTLTTDMSPLVMAAWTLTLFRTMSRYVSRDYPKEISALWLRVKILIMRLKKHVPSHVATHAWQSFEGVQIQSICSRTLSRGYVQCTI